MGTKNSFLGDFLAAMDKKVRHLYEFGPYEMEPDEWVLKKNGRVVKLERKEFQLLHYFVLRPKRLVGKTELHEQFWPLKHEDDESNPEATLPTYITELRKKIGEPGASYFQNIRKEGYRFEVDVFDRAHIPDEACPWVGLPPINERYHAYFRGRDAEVAALTARLKDARFLAVIGGSGLGKSSLIRAGLVPTLEKVSGSENVPWNCRVFEPTTSPLSKLASELIELIGGPLSKNAVDALALRLLSKPTTLVEYLVANLQTASRILLVVDQFENFLRRYEESPAQRAFIENLLDAGSSRLYSISVMLIIRTDFFAQVEQQHTELWDKIADQPFTVKRLSTAAMRKAIEEPAQDVGLEYDAALVDAILRDLQEAPGASSMLSETMVELFKRRDGIKLTYEAYQDIGGVQQRIENKAEEVFTSFSEPEQAIVRHILISLTNVAEQPENDLKRRAPLDELVVDPANYDQVSRVIARLSDERLLVTTTDYEASNIHEDRPRTWVEPSHDVLIRFWPRARNWLNAKRAAKRMFDNLDAATKEWQRDRDKASLFGGSRLAAFVDAESTLTEFMRPIHREFLEASKEARDQEQLAENQRLKAIEQRHKAVAQRRKWKRIAVVTLIALVCFAVYLFFLVSKTREANRQRRLAESLRRAADSRSQLQIDPELSLLLAIQAGRTASNAEAESSLRHALAATNLRAIFQGHSDRVISVAVSPNGEYLITGGADREARIWNISTRQTVHTLKGHAGWVYWVAFSPDGKLVITASHDSTVVIWDVSSGAALHTLKHEKGVNNATFSPDGSKVLTASEDFVARIWDWKAEQVLLPLVGHTKHVNSAVYSPDGSIIATASGDNTVKIWNAHSGKVLKTLDRHKNTVLSVAFSSDGKRLVTGSSDKLALIWNVESWLPERELKGHSLEVFSTEFSRDGQLVLTGSKDATARIWSTETGQERAVFRGHSSAVNTAVFARDDRSIFTASGDKTIRVWDVEILPKPLLLPGHSASVYSVTFSPDGNRILTASQDKTSRIWSAITGEKIAELAHADSVQDGVFSPDGNWIATACKDRVARLWNAKTGALEREYAGQHKEMIHTVRFSPDGLKLVTASRDTTAIVWDVASARVLWKLEGHLKDVYHAAFSINGNLVATAGHDGMLKIWSMKDGKEFFKHDIGYGVNSVDFSKDGEYLLAASGDRTIRVWSLSDHTSLAVLVGHDVTVNNAVFNSTSTLVASAGGDQTVRIWDFSVTGGLLFNVYLSSSVQMVSFSPDGRRFAAATKDGVVAIYDCEICYANQEQLLGIAERSKAREMTPEENKRFLSQH